MRLFALLFALSFACATPIHSQSATEKAALQLSEAASQLAIAEKAGDRIAALTSAVQAYEAGLSGLREGLVAAVLRERELKADLATKDADMAEFLTLLQTVSRHVEAEALVHPGGVLPNIQAGLLVSSMVPDLQARAEVVASQLAEVAELAALQQQGLETLEDGRAGARAARLALSEAISNRTDLPPRHATDEAAMQALLNSTETLSAFAAALSQELDALPDVSNETWQAPVLGTVLRDFEAPDAAGVSRPGMIFSAAANALVTAPTAGTVLFADQVPEQGIVVVLEPEAGLLVVLAGLGQSFARQGQIVAEGEGIGLMPGDQALAQEKLIDLMRKSGLPGGETLYMEVRQGREPIDPASLLKPGGI
jgi:septal ring factor EnvC (AmiA/AmiB activator)